MVLARKCDTPESTLDSCSSAAWICVEIGSFKCAETYEHQMLTAVIVHPDLKQVIALTPEPIQKQDGNTKNDCERNAIRRLL